MAAMTQYQLTDGGSGGGGKNKVYSGMDALKNNGGSTSNSGTYRSSSSSVSTGSAALPDYNSILAQLRAEQEAAAREAYERRTAAANEFRNAGLSAADENYNYGTGRLDVASDKSLNDSYIASMMAKRNLGQNLAYAGKSGGAAESTLLGIENSYGTARGNVEANRQSGIASLANQRAQDRAAVQQQYSSYMMGASDDLNNTLQRIKSDAAAQQAQLLQAQYEAAAKAASTQSSTNSLVSGAGAASALNDKGVAEMQRMSYSAYQNLYRQYIETGLSPNEADRLAQQGAQYNTSAWLLGMVNSGQLSPQAAYGYMG